VNARVNGSLRELPQDATVASVVSLVGAPASGVAVVLDGVVVPRARWASTSVPDGSVVEVLTAVQGG
jgi:sulfur carrier protein